jgi:NitT/TauT family transport system substrate-binding protein
MRTSLKTSLWTIILLGAVLAFRVVPVHAAMTDLDYTENWVLGAEHIGDFTALAKGFYEAEGLKVKITRGFGSGDAVKRVAAGTTKISRAAAQSVISGRAGGAKVKIIFITFHKGPYAIAYLKGKGISKPKDLEGRKIAVVAGASSTRFIPAFAKISGFDNSKMIRINMGGASLAPSLASGTVDATTGWLVNVPAFQKAAAQAGRKGQVGYFLWADYGLQLYGSVVISSDKTIGSESDLVRRYTRAAMRGYTYAIDHPKEGLDAFMKYNVGRDRKVIEGEWKYVVELTFDNLFKKNGLGYTDPGKMKSAVGLVRKYLGLKGELDSRDTFTNRFIEATPRAWRFPKRAKM